MRLFIFAALFATACSTAEPQSAAAPPASPNYGDARSNASDADVRDARRAYRSACEQHASTARCECLTGGMAQALSPADLSVATAALAGSPMSAGEGAQSRIAAAQSASERACMAYPR